MDMLFGELFLFLKKETIEKLNKKGLENALSIYSPVWSL